LPKTIFRPIFLPKNEGFCEGCESKKSEFPENARGSRAYEQTAQDQEVSSPFSDQYTPTTSNNNLKLVFPLKSNPTVNKERKRTKTNTDNYTLQNNLSLKKKVQFSAIFSHFGHLSSHILIGGIINATHSA